MSTPTDPTAGALRTPPGSTRAEVRAYLDPTALLQTMSEFLENDETATSLESRLLPAMLRDPGLYGLFVAAEIVRAWSRRHLLPESVIPKVAVAGDGRFLGVSRLLLTDQRLIDGLAWCLRTQDESAMLAFSRDARTPLQLQALWIAESSLPVDRVLVPRPIASYLLESTRSLADSLLVQHPEYQCLMTSMLEGRSLVVFERGEQEPSSTRDKGN